MPAKPRISDEAVKEKTGRSWAEWFSVLDRAGAKKLGHRDIVSIVKQLGATPWWQQGITVTYEQARGLREQHELKDGFAISVSRTLAVPAAELFAAFEDAKARARHVGTELKLRSKQAGKVLRFDVHDGSDLEVRVEPRARSRAQVVVQHKKLPSALASKRAKKFWTEVLGNLHGAKPKAASKTPKAKQA